MAFKGRILVHNDGSRVRVIADNRGDSPGILTHTLFSSSDEAQTSAYVNGQWLSHDDSNFGHNHSVPAKGVSTIELPVGQTYVRGRGGVSGERERIAIAAGAFLRVGFRYRAWSVIEVPAAGSVVEIPYEKLTPNVEVHSSLRALGWTTEPLGPADQGTADPSVNEADRVRKLAQSMHLVEGEARIAPVAREGALVGWEVSFKNTAPAPQADQTTGFTGTVTLLNAKGEGTKNAGLGLESMACPERGYSAVQFIPLHGDYGRAQFGNTAEPGTSVRLGVRGLSSVASRLPTLAEGPISFSLAAFTQDSTQFTPEWFDSVALLQKLGEKKSSVTFFKDGREINDQLPDAIYAGEEAMMRAEFKTPPRVSISVGTDGYHIECASDAPASDTLGPIAFPVSLRVQGAEGKRPVMPPSLFDGEHRTLTLVIPFTAAHVGEQLEIDTGPFGWRGVVPLPPSGKLDTASDPLRYFFLRESDYKRSGLIPEVARALLNG